MSSSVFQLSHASWLDIVTASAYTVLTKRDDALPKAKRLTVDVCSKGGLEAVASARDAGPPERIAFIKWLRDRAVDSDAAAACFDRAAHACRMELRTLPADNGVACCMSGLTDELLQVTMFGNSAHGRVETTHIVASSWLPFLESLSIVGCMHEWVDQLVTAHISLEQRTVTVDQLRLLASKTLKHGRKAVNRRAQYLTGCVL